MDKVDMSLDDIIRLNKKEQKLNKKQGTVNRRPVKKKGRLMQGKGVKSRTAALTTQRGVGLSQRGGHKLNRKMPNLPARRRGQAPGVVTGLASRRTGALLKRLGTINRTAAGSQGKRGFLTRAKTKPFTQNTASTNQYRKPEGPRKTYRQPEQQRSPNPSTVKRPFQLRRRPLPSLQTQKDARQATFLFHRGLKIQAQVQKPNPPVRSRQWRTSTNNGILTVSIDNPSARTQPEPPTAYTLHPPAVRTAPVKLETVEKKIPKGVALQFDINSVAKPTSMTLNERFRILKDQRTAKAQHAKGNRFVTVG
ncbi:UAP56-interacting factor [Boleophthalmus pectinirostris]|uniref:UAP56-interacting factor n=1 Tax=Boleophthalmus pectinirostris TaxID=150288 RepID=UPI000A1C45AB|nr:UAP56-interacting factor [Boleophthalmus pectinirostris]